MCHNIYLAEEKKVYFLSDFHLGIPDNASSAIREKYIVDFLQSIENNASTIFFLGDIFDFWWEYKYVIPKGFIRLQAQWLRMADKGISLYYFPGNHDQWINHYFTETFGFKIFTQQAIFKINNHKFFIAHGDGLGPKDYIYKFVRKLFHSSILRWLVQRLIHPDLVFIIARFLSKRSRLAEKKISDYSFLGEDKEYLILFCKSYLQKDPTINYFIFGHRHCKIDFKLNDQSYYINLGDWIHYFSYAVYDGETVLLKDYF